MYTLFSPCDNDWLLSKFQLRLYNPLEFLFLHFQLIVSPNSLIYAAFYFCIGWCVLPIHFVCIKANPCQCKTIVYTNLFLATLNTRENIKDHIQDTNFMMISIPTARLSHSTRMLTNSKPQKSIVISVAKVWFWTEVQTSTPWTKLKVQFKVWSICWTKPKVQFKVQPVIKRFEPEPNLGWN